MEKWAGFEIMQDAVLPHIFAIVVIVIILVVLSFIYFLQNKNVKPSDEPRTFTLIVDNLIITVKQMVVQTFGPQYVKLTPYFLFLICFLGLSNIFAIFGIKEPTTSYSVPLTLGLITWISSIFCSIKYQRLVFLKKFFFKISIKGNQIPVMINPLEILSVITPLISITFRLWGNIIAGYILYAVIFWACASLSTAYAPVVVLLVGGVILMPFMIFYFSLFTGIIQAYVFTLLSMSYISAPILDGLSLQLAKQQKTQTQSKGV